MKSADVLYFCRPFLNFSIFEKCIVNKTRKIGTPCRLLACLFLVPLFFADLAAAFEVPALTGRVVDTVDLFNQVEEEQINADLLRLEEETGGQMVVVTLAPLQNESIEEAGLAIFNAWKIGSKEKDDGVVFIIIPESKKMRLEIGYGWEGVLTDARAGDLIRNAAPLFRTNQYADGVSETIHRISQTIQTGELPTLPAKVASGEKLSLPEMICAILMTLFLTLLIFLGTLQRLSAFIAKKWSSPFFASVASRLQKFLGNSDKPVWKSSGDKGRSDGTYSSGGGNSGGGFSGGGGRSGGGGASGGW